MPSMKCLPVVLLAVVFLLELCETIYASDGVAPPRLKLFTIFSVDDGDKEIAASKAASPSSSLNSSGDGNNSVGAVGMNAVKAADSDFILVSAWIFSEAGAPPVTVDGYQATDSKQILYQKEHWTLMQEGTFYEDVPFMWARFQSTAVESASACLAVAQWSDNSNNNDDQLKHAASLIAFVSGSCKAGDIMALALTSPVPISVAEYLESKGAAGSLVEASHVLQQQQYLSSSSVTVSNLPSATSSRLFLRLQDSMCIDKAATPVVPAGLRNSQVAPWEALALELCSGSGCQICKPSSPADDQTPPPPTSASKHIVGIVVSCSVFIAASIALLFMLFRRHFFAPDESTKEEKELTTNLAYVLRI